MRTVRIVGFIGATLLAIGGSITGVGPRPNSAHAIQAPRQMPPPQVCEGFYEYRPTNISPSAVWDVAETGQYGQSVGGLGVAGRKCWRKFNQLSRTVVDQGPQILTRGGSISLSLTSWGRNDKKYGAALNDVRRLYDELLPLTKT